MKALNRRDSAGFTLIEVVMVITILGALASMAIPHYAAYQEKARKARCAAHRYYIQMEEETYFLGHNSVNLKIDERWSCPSGGVYVWVVSDPKDAGYPRVICSVHGEGQAKEVEKLLTSLGSTFEEITGAMTRLIEDFYKKNGRYPRSFGDYRFSDIGLDPAEWGNSYDGIIYTPVGNRITVKPDEGFAFVVTTTKGKERELSSKQNWSLIYSVEDRQWYYKSIGKNNVVDITTLKVVRG
ncbi:MAG: prepilin-type N-terminal cleavage/methylation domain-containing protein [Deltaproteobacteria bacterium]|nr:prepilin-type N-terminal cleavage/methylation domain-containing protein [Deltaproteobacteria bacterium]